MALMAFIICSSSSSCCCLRQVGSPWQRLLMWFALKALLHSLDSESVLDFTLDLPGHSKIVDEKSLFQARDKRSLLSVSDQSPSAEQRCIAKSPT